MPFGPAGAQRLKDFCYMALIDLKHGRARITRRSSWLLTRGLVGYPAVYRGSFQALRKAGHTGG